MFVYQFIFTVITYNEPRLVFCQQLFLEVMPRARPGVENARKLNFNLSSVCILTKNPICILLSEIDRAIYSV